jgi:hypothetical protein
MRSHLPLAFALSLLLVAPAALADGIPITDQVQTTDGGTYRGTIVADVPNGEVVLQLPTGETKHFARAEIRYAGPLAGAQAPVDGAARPTTGFTVHASTISVTFESSEATTLYAQDSWATTGGVTAHGYARICTSPCSLTMPVGTQHFALSRGNDSPRPVQDPVTVEQSSTLHAAWQSRSGSRLAGILLLAIGIPAGAVTAGAGFAVGYADSTCNQPGCYGTPRALTWLGAGVALASALGGAILVTRRDIPSIQVTPFAAPPAQGGATPAAAPIGTNADMRRTALGTAGLGVTVRF